MLGEKRCKDDFGLKEIQTAIGIHMYIPFKSMYILPVGIFKNTEGTEEN